jgi:hypothetical protein
VLFRSVQFKGLCATPGKLVEQGYAIIHSVKDFADQREADIREFFRGRRTALEKPSLQIAS